SGVVDGGNQNGKAKSAAIVGSTIASMIAIESIRIVFWAAAIGPCGSRMFIGERLPIPSSSEKSSAIARRIIAAGAANLTADPHRQEPDPRSRPKTPLD